MSRVRAKFAKKSSVSEALNKFRLPSRPSSNGSNDGRFALFGNRQTERESGFASLFHRLETEQPIVTGTMDLIHGESNHLFMFTVRLGICRDNNGQTICLSRPTWGPSFG